MSDCWITIIPESPDVVLPATTREQLRAWFEDVATPSDEIEIVESATTRFFDCGGNFERMSCSSCGTDANAWWATEMDAHYSASGFVLRKFALPCCDHVATLHELNYEWPQGFARCAISIRNPSIGQLSGDQIAPLEAISGARVRVIYRHL